MEQSDEVTIKMTSEKIDQLLRNTRDVLEGEYWDSDQDIAEFARQLELLIDRYRI